MASGSSETLINAKDYPQHTYNRPENWQAFMIEQAKKFEDRDRVISVK